MEKLQIILNKFKQDFDKDKIIFCIIALSILLIPFLTRTNEHLKVFSVSCLFILFIPTGLIFHFKEQLFYKHLRKINIILTSGITILLILTLIFRRLIK